MLIINYLYRDYGESMLGIEELLSDIIGRVNIEMGVDLPFETKKHTEDISSEIYKITTEEMSQRYSREKGEYEIYSIPTPMELGKSTRKKIIGYLSNSVSRLLGKVNSKSRVLIVGLGNRYISSDSLGARVCNKIGITIDAKFLPTVMAICPSVLGLTGIETYDIISGVIEKVKPTHLVLIDSLCASSVERLARSIQLSSTGLCPGSGIGNNRRCIDNSLCDKVVSIGVPLLIFASTFIKETFNKNSIDISAITDIMQNTENMSNNESFLDFIDAIKKVYNDDVDDIVVSHKDIDAMVEIMSEMIAMAINKSLGVLELIDK